MDKKIGSNVSSGAEKVEKVEKKSAAKKQSAAKSASERARAQAQAAEAVIPAYEGTAELWAAKFADYNTDAFLGAIKSGAAHQLPAANKNVQQIYTRFNDYMTEMLTTGEIESNLAAMEAEFNELLK